MLDAITMIKTKLEYKRYLRKIRRENDKTIYLTFDDGPSEEYTLLILQLLKEYNIKATFFMVADFAKANVEVVKRVSDDGHAIGLHSKSHKNPFFQNRAEAKIDIEESKFMLEGILDRPVNLYRPPWLRTNMATKEYADKNNIKIVLCDVMAGDWKSSKNEDALGYELLKKVKSTSVICLHDGRGEEGATLNMIKALRITLPIWIREGYKFKVL